MKNTTKKLALNKVKLTTLDNSQTKNVKGGYIIPAWPYRHCYFQTIEDSCNTTGEERE